MNHANPQKEQDGLDLPAGTVTFLFTDIAGSTQLLRHLGEGYAEMLAEHHRLLREIFSRHHGREVDTQGDAFFVSFPRARDAVGAGVEAQRALQEHPWPGEVRVRVRMGLHTGEPLATGEGYVGMDVHRAARIAAVGHGGQVLLSETTASLVRDDLPAGVTLRELGRYELKDMIEPTAIHQLVIAGLDQQFPPLKADMVGVAVRLKESGKPPAFLDERGHEVERPLFVAREAELAWLGDKLAKVCGGEGQVVFLTGEAGAGKTALMQEFIDRVQAAHSDILVTFGQCNAYAGMGDPYLPFRQVMDMLSGDVEGQYLAGRISREHALRLWQSLPEVGAALADGGPDLMGVFVDGRKLVARLVAGGHARQANELNERMMQGEGNRQQTQLFAQYARVLQVVAEKRPVLLVLDDLQWTDTGSVNLLFHLGRELQDSSVLVLCAYRPEEVESGRHGQRHPLEKVLAEIKRLYGDVWCRLNRMEVSERRAFVDALIDSEVNQLGERFRQALFEHTGGQALFTVELLRDLQERGDLVWDEESGWYQRGALAWAHLPARVEGVIEERIERLEAELRDILSIASVEGEDFTAQVVARVREANERRVVQQLSQELDRKHRLVGEQGVRQLEKERLYRYRFRHSLFQQHLYHGLGEMERGLLHEDVGLVLEALYGEAAMDIAPQLAWHFSEAGVGEKAVLYLLRAGDGARRDFAFLEAVHHYERALDFLREDDVGGQMGRTLMKLGMCLHESFRYEEAQRTFDEASALSAQTVDLISAVEEIPALHPLRIAVMEDPSSLDPLDGPSGTGDVISQIFSGLFHLCADNEVEADIARSWQILDEGLRYIFTLRDDVVWSDGIQVKASDFAYAWKRVLDPSNATGLPYLLFDLKNARAYHEGRLGDWTEVGVAARDDITLEITLEAPASYFLQVLANPNTFPVPEHQVRTHGAEWIEPQNLVSNGPYLLVSRVPGERMIFRRNPRYHGEFRGNCSLVELTTYFVPNYRPALTPYLEDTLDVVWVMHLPAEEVIWAYRHLADEMIKVHHDLVVGVAFNCRRPPFDSPLVRRALAMAIDKPKIIRLMRQKWLPNVPIARDIHLPAYGGIITPNMPGHSPDIGLPYDLKAARQLLVQAGYPDGRGFPETLGVSYVFKGMKKTFETLERMWREDLGVNIRWEFVPDGEWDEVYRKQDILLWPLAWEPDYHDPCSFLCAPFIEETGWKHREYDDLIHSAQTLVEHEQRIELYKQADRILVTECPYIPIWYGPLQQRLLVKPWVKRWYHTDWKDVFIERH